MWDSVKAAAKNLGRKKLRSSLTILGITIGVASVILIGNIGQCGTQAVNAEVNSLGLGGLTISAGSQEGGEAGLTLEDLKTIRKTASVEEAAPVIMQNTKIGYRNEQMDALVWGIDTKASQVISLQVLYGRSISNGDVNTCANVCMVDQNFARAAYNRDNIVGKHISVLYNGIQENFEVVGVIKTGSGLLSNIIGDYIPNFVYVPYSTLQHTTGNNYFDQIAVRVEAGSDADEIGQTIVNTLARVNGGGEYVSNNLVKQKDGLLKLMDIVTLVLSAVGAISLLVASLSIMTVMLVSVNERTREIGIKKSIGAKRSTILLEFLLEAVLISIIGCGIGVIIGNGISYVGASLFGLTLSLRLDVMGSAVLFSLLTGIIFGVYPAVKASAMRPVDALRQD